MKYMWPLLCVIFTIKNTLIYNVEYYILKESDFWVLHKRHRWFCYLEFFKAERRKWAAMRRHKAFASNSEFLKKILKPSKGSLCLRWTVLLFNNFFYAGDYYDISVPEVIAQTAPKRGYSFFSPLQWKSEKNVQERQNKCKWPTKHRGKCRSKFVWYYLERYK